MKDKREIDGELVGIFYILFFLPLTVNKVKYSDEMKSCNCRMSASFTFRQCLEDAVFKVFVYCVYN